MRNALMAAILIVAACGAESSSLGSAITERDSAGVVIVENDLARLSDRCMIGDEPSVVVGTAIGDPAYQLHRVFGGTVMSDGRIALVDQGSQQIRFYDADGTFLSASGGEGGGPGEFNDAFLLFRIRGDTIWVGDYGPWGYEVFAPSGTWVRGVRPRPTQGNNPQSAGVLDDGRSIMGVRDYTNRDPGFGLDYLHILMHDRDGALLDTLEVAPYGRWGLTTDDTVGPWVYPWFEAVTHMDAAADRWLIGHGSAPELRVHAMEGGQVLERLVRWTAGDRTVDAEDLATARAEFEARYDNIDPSTRRIMLEPMLTDRRPVADSMPVMSDVAIGTAGAMWVEVYARPGRADRADWLGFGADGRFVCHLTLPPGLEVYEFGPDYVLGHQEGELGAEQVVRYELTRPTR